MESVLRNQPAANGPPARKRATDAVPRGDVSFEPPAVPALAVARRRIVSLLDLALHQRLTMVVTAPGYGKTVLLAQWAAAHPRQRIRWLTLTAAHNEAATLTRDLGSALGTKRPRSWPETAPRPGVRGAPPPTVAALLGDLERMPPTTLVLDDFHVITDPALLDDLATFIEHAPRSLRVVIATRVDPPLRYYRLSLSDAVVELRQEDLAFTDDEASELLRRLTDAELRPSQLEKLMARTEGWVTGLQLAALSLRGRTQVDDFVDAFAGDDRYVADYLTEQVLRRQPEDIRDFLLSTCVLDTMTGPLCDFVTGKPGGAVMLEELERRSMFITPLDTRRLSFRYHQLFRALLRQHLHEGSPGREQVLLGRAAAWHLARDEHDKGARYLAEAGAWDQLLDAARVHGRDMLARDRAGAVAEWIEMAPLAVRAGDIPVALLEAGSLIMGGDSSRALEALDAVEAPGERGPLPAGERLVARFLRACAALQHGDCPEAVAAAQATLTELHAARGAPLPDVLGLTDTLDDIAVGAGAVKAAALVYQNRFSEARVSLDAMPEPRHAMWQTSAAGARALLEAWSGNLGAAERSATAALSLADKIGVRPGPSTIDAYLALAVVARERGDLDRVRSLLADADRVPRSARRRIVDTLVASEQAQLALAEGQPAAGLTMLASRRLGEPTVPAALVSYRRAVEGELLTAVGELNSAARALDAAPVITSDVVAGKVRLAVERGDLQLARRLIDGWPETPVPRAGLERLLWRAIVDHLEGHAEPALRAMALVVAEAEREGNIGLFRSNQALGPARALYRSNPVPFLRAIVDQPIASVRAKPVKELVEQLTEREYAVLPLLPTRLSNAEIAETLGVSLNTVKTHLKHIYRKLGVTERSAAIAAAERLHLW